MTDKIEQIGHSSFQHGKNNRRIYLMKSAPEDMPQLLGKLDALAEKKSYTKIFAKIPADQKKGFIDDGYRVEASVPGLYHGREKGLFLGKYFDEERKQEQHPDLVADVLSAAKAKRGLMGGMGEPSSICRPLTGDDMEEAAEVYREVFASYPFPIHDPDYLRETMDHIFYYGVWFGERLVALSSAEIDFDNGNAEMTDFATLPEQRGKGFANLLLTRMEADMKKRGISALYTIARAYSHGMNITFAKHDYLYSGTLTNNTQISGQLESMNVWYKLLALDIMA